MTEDTIQMRRQPLIGFRAALTVAAASPLSHQQNRDPDGYEDHSRNDQER
jgi:hypothetical protein